jgi:hypothetical protein
MRSDGGGQYFDYIIRKISADVYIYTQIDDQV